MATRKGAKSKRCPPCKVRFDHTSGEFTSIKVVESMLDQLEIESTILHKDSDEAQKQMEVGSFWGFFLHFPYLISPIIFQFDQIEGGVRDSAKTRRAAASNTQKNVKNAKKEKVRNRCNFQT